MSTRKAHPDLLLERFALGELSDEEREQVERNLSDADRERLAAIQADNEATLEQHPPARMATQIEGRRRIRAIAQKQERTKKRQLFLAVPALAAAAMVAIVILPEPPPTERIKGDPALVVYRKTNTGDEQLRKESVARAGDLIQMRYQAGGYDFGMVLSVDGRGTVTLHHPATSRQPSPKLRSSTTTDQLIALPESYELDDAPLFERFIFVLSRNQFEPEEVLQAANDLEPSDAPTASLPLDERFEQVSVILRKVEQ